MDNNSLMVLALPRSGEHMELWQKYTQMAGRGSRILR